MSINQRNAEMQALVILDCWANDKYTTERMIERMNTIRDTYGVLLMCLVQEEDIDFFIEGTDTSRFKFNYN